jgi:hypothetical protein
MEIFSESVLFRSVNAGGLFAIDKGRAKASVKVLLEKPHEIAANVVGVMALQAWSRAQVPDEHMGCRPIFPAVRIGNVAS